MTNSVYATRQDAIELEIMPALGDFADDFDIDAIADEALDSDSSGYWIRVSPEEFYKIASKYDREAK